MSKRSASERDITVGDVIQLAKKAKSGVEMGAKVAKSVGQAVARVARGMPFVKGKERIAGYYGRYNLPGGGSEEKFFDTAVGFYFDATATEIPSGGQLNLIPQGITESTRVGRKCTISSIHLRGLMSMENQSNATSVFLLVVLDKQCNGTAATPSEVMDNIIKGQINLANSERFTILKRMVYDFTPKIANQRIYQYVDWYHKCTVPLEFSSTTGALTEIRSNNLFLLAVAAGGDDVVQFDGTCRLRFSDS